MKGRIRHPGAQTMRLPIIGKLKCGMKVKGQGGKEYPTSVDYFIPVGKYATLFSQTFGEKPNRITIVFPSDNLSEVCDERYEIRDPKGDLYGIGDGVDFQIYDSSLGDYVPKSVTDDPDLMERTAARCSTVKNGVTTPGKWYVLLQLRFIIPEIRGVVGLWQLSTKGVESSIPNIRDSFDFVMNHAKTVQKIPFDLMVEKVKSQKPETQSVFPVITIVPNVSAGHLETVAAFLDEHDLTNVRGLLTESNIDQLRLGPHQEEPKVEDAEFTVEKTPLEEWDALGREVMGDAWATMGRAKTAKQYQATPETLTPTQLEDSITRMRAAMEQMKREAEEVQQEFSQEVHDGDPT